jgi:phosphate transport system permease protein
MKPRGPADGLVARILQKARQTFDGIIAWFLHPDFLQLLVFVAALSIPALWFLMVDRISASSLLAFNTFGPRFIVGTDWIPSPSPGHLPSLGALPAIYGSVVTTSLALLIAAPVSLGVGLFQSELAPRPLRSPSVFLVEMLAAVPSVVYGLWGIVILVPFMRDNIDPGLQSTLGALPLFSGPANGQGMLTASVILAIMVVPYSSSIMREVFAAVPKSQREAMIALGATNWETVRKSVIPFARTGIVAAVMLALGRAIGETMAVTMTIGNTAKISPSLFSSAYTIPSIIANEFVGADTALHVSSLIALGLILFAITFLMNIFARLLIRRLSFKGRHGQVA